MIRRSINVLLTLAIEREKDEEPTEHATQADILLLMEDGLIDERGIVTEKGEAYIAALEGVPLPVQRWVIPEPAIGLSLVGVNEAERAALRQLEAPAEPPNKGKKRGNRT